MNKQPNPMEEKKFDYLDFEIELKKTIKLYIKDDDEVADLANLLGKFIFENINKHFTPNSQIEEAYKDCSGEKLNKLLSKEDKK